MGLIVRRFAWTAEEAFASLVDAHLEPGLPAHVESAWLARIHESASRAIARFLDENRLDLAGFDRLVFD